MPVVQSSLIPVPAPPPPPPPGVLQATGKAPVPAHVRAEAARKARWLTASPSEFQSRWSAFVQQARNTAGADPNALVQAVLRASYEQTTQDLREFAERVKQANARKSALRSQGQALRGPRLAAAPPKPIIVGSALGPEAALLAEIRKWEEKLNTLGDDAQLANVDLQNILQKQQQTLQMLSNISKMLHDTAQSVIRKMGG